MKPTKISDSIPTIRCGGRLLELTRPLVMGIVNATPDSFYSGSRTPESEGLHARVERLLGDGADILDIGGYSTRSGAAEVSADEEWRRVALALQAVREVAGDETVVSVDTFRSEVAARSVEEFGADIINDISGGDLDPEMFATVAGLKVAYVLMHTRGNPATMQSLTDYSDVTAEVLSDLVHKADRLRDIGVADIILDPGFGFAKTVEQNFRLLAELDQFVMTGMPVLAGLSRKTMIYRSLDITPEESLPGTVALNMAALERGATILRVHDVREAVQTVRLFECLRKEVAVC